MLLGILVVETMILKSNVAETHSSIAAATRAIFHSRFSRAIFHSRFSRAIFKASRRKIVTWVQGVPAKFADRKTDKIFGAFNFSGIFQKLLHYQRKTYYTHRNFDVRWQHNNFPKISQVKKCTYSRGLKGFLNHLKQVLRTWY